MVEADAVLMVDWQTGLVEWRSGTMWLGHHLRLADDHGQEPEILVIHSRGYSVGPRHDRVYVPAGYRVFNVLDSDDAGVRSVRHVTSFPVRLGDRGAANTGLSIYWRPYPDPQRAIGNGKSVHPSPDTLSDRKHESQLAEQFKP